MILYDHICSAHLLPFFVCLFFCCCCCCNRALCFRPANVSQAPSLDNNTCPVDGTTDIAKSCSISRSTRYAVYGSVVYSTVLIHFVRGILFYLVCINASKTLHNKMFSNILRVPVRFFDTNASGKLICLFVCFQSILFVFKAFCLFSKHFVCFQSILFRAGGILLWIIYYFITHLPRCSVEINVFELG